MVWVPHIISRGHIEGCAQREYSGDCGGIIAYWSSIVWRLGI
jgi:hypothetical protein